MRLMAVFLACGLSTSCFAATPDWLRGHWVAVGEFIEKEPNGRFPDGRLSPDGFGHETARLTIDVTRDEIMVSPTTHLIDLIDARHVSSTESQAPLDSDQQLVAVGDVSVPAAHQSLRKATLGSSECISWNFGSTLPRRYDTPGGDHPYPPYRTLKCPVTVVRLPDGMVAWAISDAYVVFKKLDVPIVVYQ